MSMKNYYSELSQLRILFRNTILASFLVSSIGIVIFHDSLLIGYGMWLSTSDPHSIADVAVSLGGENRLETAVGLLANGHAPNGLFVKF